MRLDDDTYLDTPSHSIGEIKLVIYRTAMPKRIQKRTIKATPPLSCLQKVHERSKKGMAHRVKYVASLTLYNAWHSSFTLNDKQLWYQNSITKSICI